jgi:esterase/lipase superfamily enzyme
LLIPDKNVFVFIHGYKNSFQSGLHTAAKMSYYAERPLIFYSWPSVCRFRSYDSDENNCEWSQEHFNEVVTQLDTLCIADPSVKIRLMAHSMGSRLAVRACPLLREKRWLAEAALICPDIDDGLVKHYAKRYLSANGTCKIRVYMSQQDKALAISQFLHGGYTRFGERADSLSGWTLNALKGNSGNQASKDDPELAAKLEATKHRMQTIDFTNIDSGIVGHKVPAKLICSMSFTDGPPSGLKLVPERSGQRSKLSERLSKFTKLHDNQELSVKGICLRVVKLDSSYNKQIAKIIAPSTP